jgi:hypothetical protein
MPTPSSPPVRRGKQMYLSLDPDAAALLQAMVMNRKAVGLLLSELIRKEAERRAERPRLLAALAAEAGEEP